MEIIFGRLEEEFAALGIGLGVVGALLLSRFLESLLFGITATDPATYGALALILAGVAALAGYGPARRVTTDGDVVCLVADSGKEVWRRSLTIDFEGYLMKAMGSYERRSSESPLVDGDRVIVTPGHIEAMMVALDKKIGAEIWRTQAGRIGRLGADGAGYSSPVILEATGVRQYVTLVGRGLIGVEAETSRCRAGRCRSSPMVGSFFANKTAFSAMTSVPSPRTDLTIPETPDASTDCASTDVAVLRSRATRPARLGRAVGREGATRARIPPMVLR